MPKRHFWAFRFVPTACASPCIYIVLQPYISNLAAVSLVHFANQASELRSDGGVLIRNATTVSVRLVHDHRTYRAVQQPTSTKHSQKKTSLLSLLHLIFSLQAQRWLRVVYMGPYHQYKGYIYKTIAYVCWKPSTTRVWNAGSLPVFIFNFFFLSSLFILLIVDVVCIPLSRSPLFVLWTCCVGQVALLAKRCRRARISSGCCFADVWWLLSPLYRVYIRYPHASSIPYVPW